MKPRSLSVTSLGTIELLKPKIVLLSSPPSKLNKLGDELRLLVLLTGYPCTDVKWYLNGDIIKPTTDNRISFLNNSRELLIKNLRAEDDGTILVQAVNKYGEAFTSSTLRIEKSKKIPLKKSFTVGPVRRKLNRVFSMKW